MEAILATIVGFSIVFWGGLRYLERQQYWTLRLWLSLGTPYLLFIPTSAIGLSILSAFLNLQSEDFGQDVHSFFIPAGATMLVVDSIRNVTLLGLRLGAVAYLIFFFQFILAHVTSARYLLLRWRAWTGPSRTGIAPTYSKLVGDQDDWIEINRALGLSPQHPVEKFSQVVSFGGIAADPTDLLRAASVTQRSRTTPRSKFRAGAYQPCLDDESISLLWGEDLGFRKRCSRGIISVSRSLLESRPTFDSGREGRAVCLAYGILARNKGPEPQNLVCNLNVQNFRVFEENSVQWPRPAKTLRSIYRAEFARTFSQLGESYITAATELGLLLADTHDDLIKDWLEGVMEHQELRLNHQAAALGATPDELARLYRGHYAAMLVSLSTHQKGIRLRPEVLVYDALRRLDGVQNDSDWISASVIVDRRHQEVSQLGEMGQRLILAVI